MTTSNNPVQSHSAMTKRHFPLSAGLWGVLISLAIASAHAGNLFWDANGTTAGAGTTLTGTWGTDSYWSTNSAGTAVPGAWVSGETAVFSAGTDATGLFTVTLNGTQAAGGVSVEEGSLTLTGSDLSLALPATVTCATTGIFNTVITGTSGLTKFGNGDLVLRGANTFTGNLTNRQGLVTLEHAQAASSGVIALNPVSGSVILRGTVDLSIPNDISLLGSSTIDLTAEENKSFTLTGVISGSRGFSAGGKGKLVLGGTSANTFTGPLTISQGTVVVAKDGALGSVANATTVNSGATLAFQSASTLNYLTLESINVSGTGVAGAGAIQNLQGENFFSGTVALAADSSVNVAAGTLLTLVGAVTGGGLDITKTGSGILDLTSSANTYYRTFVNAGTLGVWGGTTIHAGTGLVTVSSGARLEGTGNAPGGVNLSGTIAPGASPGIFYSGSQTWNMGGTYEWQVADANSDYDQLQITGSLTVNSTSGNPFVIKISSLDPFLYDPDEADHFTNTVEKNWAIASTTTGISGFDASKFTLNDDDFSNDQGGGRFVLVRNKDQT